MASVATTATGGTPSRTRHDYFGGEIPWVKSGELEDCEIHRTDETLSATGLANSSAKIFKRGTLLVALYGATVGKTAILAVDAATNQAVCAIHPKSNMLLSQFLQYHLMRWRPQLLRSRYGGAQPNISQKIIQDVPVPIPPLAEQRAIAAVLGKLQAAVAAQQAIIDRTAELKAALMAKLFTEGTRDEPQKETEIGPVPQSWELHRLVDIARVERGKFTHRPRNDPAFYGGNIPFIQTGDVTASNGRVTTYSQTLNERGLSVSKRFPKGTILTTIAANIGDFAILDFECAFPDSIVGITPDSSDLTEYLCYFLQTRKEYLNQIAPRGTQKNVNLNILEPLPVAVPEKAERDEMVTLFQAVDNRNRAALDQRELSRELFSAMLDELMTGRIRVSDLDLAELELCP